VGSTGGDEGIVGTFKEGGGGLVGVFDGKTTPALAVDGGSPDCIVVAPFCLGCSPCGECPARTVPVAKLTRVPGERLGSKSKMWGREA
jgi:hypothetical protein